VGEKSEGESFCALHTGCRGNGGIGVAYTMGLKQRDDLRDMGNGSIKKWVAVYQTNAGSSLMRRICVLSVQAAWTREVLQRTYIEAVRERLD